MINIKGKDLKVGNIVRTSDNYYNRCWIVLKVTKKDLKKGINCDKPGFFLFGGYWYGRNPHKIDSYGKVISICLDENYELIHKNTWKLNNKYLKTIFG